MHSRKIIFKLNILNSKLCKAPGSFYRIEISSSFVTSFANFLSSLLSYYQYRAVSNGGEEVGALYCARSTWSDPNALTKETEVLDHGNKESDVLCHFKYAISWLLRAHHNSAPD